MKFLLVIALFAGVRADAEADPQLLVHSGFVHTPLVYAHHAVPHAPVVKSVEVKPAEVETKTTPLVTYGYPYLHAPYNGLWGHGLPLTVPLSGAPAAAAEAEAPAVEAAERKKREADAEADAEADPYYLYHPYVYTPLVKPVVKKVEYKAPALTYPYTYGYPYRFGYHGVHPYTFGYHGYPYVVTKPVEAEAEAEAVEAERKKRDADAEADPAVLASYTTYTHPAVTYNLPYAATNGVYAGYPYAHVPVVKSAVKTVPYAYP